MFDFFSIKAVTNAQLFHMHVCNIDSMFCDSGIKLEVKFYMFFHTFENKGNL